MDEMNSADGPDRPGMSRRRMLAGVGAGAATVWVAPAITRMAVAEAAPSPPPPPPPGPQTATTFDLYTSFKASLTTPASLAPFSFLAFNLFDGPLALVFKSPGDIFALPSYQGNDPNAAHFPLAAINTSNGSVTTGNVMIPATSVVLHPGPSYRAVVAFNIPSNATAVAFTATFTDVDLGGAPASDGVLVSIVARKKAGGLQDLTGLPTHIGNTAPNNSVTFTGNASPAIYDRVFAVVNKRGNYNNDSTSVAFKLVVS